MGSGSKDPTSKSHAPLNQACEVYAGSDLGVQGICSVDPVVLNDQVVFMSHMTRLVLRLRLKQIQELLCFKLLLLPSCSDIVKDL